MKKLLSLLALVLAISTASVSAQSFNQNGVVGSTDFAMQPELDSAVNTLDTKINNLSTATTNNLNSEIASIRGDIAEMHEFERRADKKNRAGIASAVALGMMPSDPGMLTMGASTFGGQHAIAVGGSTVFKERHVVKMGLSYNSAQDEAFGVGYGYQF